MSPTPARLENLTQQARDNDCFRRVLATGPHTQVVIMSIPPGGDIGDEVHGDTDQTPFGLGTYGSRSTPVSGAATAVVARKVRERARLVASAMLEVDPDDLEWTKGRWGVRGDPAQSKTIQQIALAAHSNLELPEGVEGHLDATTVYNPPNLTFPFGAYVCVVDVDPGTGQVKVRRFIAVDDCGVRINPMIVEGQVHGGLAQGIGQALIENCVYDEGGQLISGSYMDYCMPRANNFPQFQVATTETPCTHNTLGVKGCGEAGAIGAPPAVMNAVTDAIGVRISMPASPEKVWRALQDKVLPQAAE